MRGDKKAMPSFGEFRLYVGTEEEKKGLEKLCSQWSKADFWPVAEFYISLKIPHTFLIYLHSSNLWHGLALGRETGGSVELFFIYIDPSFRRQSFGQQLLQVFITKASELYTAERIFLEVRPSNIGGIRLYENMGFRKQGKRTRYYSDGEDAWIYELELGSREYSSQ